LIWLAIGCGGLLLLTGLVIAAVVGGTLFFVSKTVSPKDSVETAQSIADYTIPGGEVGLRNIDVGPLKMALVASSSKPPDLVLTLVSVTGSSAKPSNSPRTSEEIVDAWQLMSDDEMGGTFEKTGKRTESKQLCGQPVSVEIEDGKMTVAEKSLPAVSYKASTRFKNSQRFVVVMANGESAQTNAESVFNSIQCK